MNGLSYQVFSVPLGSLKQHVAIKLPEPALMGGQTIGGIRAGRGGGVKEGEEEGEETG